MGRSRQQRRADRKRREAQARRRDGAEAGVPPGFGSPAGARTGSPSDDHANGSPASSSSGSGRSSTGGIPVDVDQLLAAAAAIVARTGIDDPTLDRIIDALVDHDGLAGTEPGRREGRQRPEPLLTTQLLDAVERLWEAGWQPLDLVHVIRRRCSPRTARLAVVVIRAEAGRSPRRDLMPEEWAGQLATLGGTPDRVPGADAVAAWRTGERLGLADSLTEGLRMLGTMRTFGPLAQLGEPPSRWTRPAPAAPGPASGTEHAWPRPEASTKTLATIRALLAKAEATNFPAEAEAFAAKAQELMTRYSIDQAMLDPASADLTTGVRTRRIHLDQPYAKEKVELLATVAGVNRVRTVFHEAYSFATVVGFPADLDVTDMLFTSLLVQASRALGEATATIGRGSSPAFRRGFWVAYAVRIGERLDDAERHAAAEAASSYGTALVPVLAARTEAVAEVTKQLFAHTVPMKARSVDAQGWYAGRSAADRASLTSTHPRLPR